jgi:hypothetical protein
MIDDLKPILFIFCFSFFVVIFGVFLPIVLITNYTSERSCSNYQKVTGKRTQYKFLDSCYIETSSGWQRYDEYITRAIASEIKK